jgi:hypothetical protein
MNQPFDPQAYAMPTPREMREIDRDARIYRSVTDEVLHTSAYLERKIRSLFVAVIVLGAGVVALGAAVLVLWLTLTP